MFGSLILVRNSRLGFLFVHFVCLVFVGVFGLHFQGNACPHHQHHRRTPNGHNDCNCSGGDCTQKGNDFVCLFQTKIMYCYLCVRACFVMANFAVIMCAAHHNEPEGVCVSEKLLTSEDTEKSFPLTCASENRVHKWENKTEHGTEHNFVKMVKVLLTE